MTSIQKLLILSLSILSIQAFGQGGTLRGTVKDAQNGEDLIGATVKVVGSKLGATTDINGFFSISNVPFGKVNLAVTYVSYKNTSVNNVEVIEGKITEVNIKMSSDEVNLEEVKIVGQRMTGTEVSTMSEVKASSMVVNGISAQQISKTLDRDAAQVVKRIPGIAIVGERFINIRGLNQRYNNVMLHNVFTPSMETDVKAFSFDIIPSNQIDRILVYKSPSAEIPAEFAGGLVKIFTKSIPEKNQIIFDYSTAFRQNTTGQDFFAPEQGKFYWTGFNNKYSSLPQYFPAKVSDLSNNAAALDAAGKMLNNNWVASAMPAIPDQRVALTINRRWDKGQRKVGQITTINYANTKTNFGISRSDFNANINNTQSPIYHFLDQQYANNIRLGIMHNWAFRINDQHSIEFKNLFNQMSNSNYTNRSGRAIEANYVPDNHSFNQVYRGIYSGQILGKHKFNKDKTVVDWVTGLNLSYREQPDYRRYRSDVQPSSTESSVSSIYVPVGTAQAFFLGRWFSEMKENTYSGNVTLSHAIKETEIKTGLFYEKKDRTFDGRNIGYVRSSGFNEALFTGSITNLFENINSKTGIKLDEQTNPNDSYTAGNDLYAGFVNYSIPLFNKLNIVAGVRAEHNTQSLSSAFLGGTKVSVKNPVLSILPSSNITYTFSEKSLVRAAYGKTINRPEFRELAPFSFYDFDFNVVYEGYTGLNLSTVDNFDFRYEFYPTPSELISLAVFYKHFNNPIEIEVEPGSGSLGAKTFIYQNAQNAKNGGIELEVKKTLGKYSVSPQLARTSVLFNAALIKSRVKLRQGAEGQSDNRPLQGQSPYLVNFGLNYNHEKKDFQVNLLYNVIGKRIFAVGFEGYPDLYEMPRNVVDLTISKTFKDKWMLKGGVQDIFNQSQLILQDGNQDGVLKASADEVMQNYKPGRSVSVGVSLFF